MAGQRSVVFLAAPYCWRFDPATGTKDIDLKNTLQKILGLLKKKGYEVLSSHEKQEWGGKTYGTPFIRSFGSEMD